MRRCCPPTATITTILFCKRKGGSRARGAPHTFDVSGFASMLGRIRSNAEPSIAVPVFDRGIEIARNSARLVPGGVRHVIVEGNYLLLELPPWDALEAFFDTTVFLEVPRNHPGRAASRTVDEARARGEESQAGRERSPERQSRDDAEPRVGVRHSQPLTPVAHDFGMSRSMLENRVEVGVASFMLPVSPASCFGRCPFTSLQPQSVPTPTRVPQKVNGRPRLPA